MEIGGCFDDILVDEYQDTNKLQASILLKLRCDGRSLAVVGDDAQAIYSFRAATVRNIRNFPYQFQRPARIIKLEENYRSTQPILRAANEVMRFAKDRFTKNLWSNRKSKRKPCLTIVADEATQARYLAQQILRARGEGVSLRQQIVLVRASHQSAQLGACSLQHPICQIWRPQIYRYRSCERRNQPVSLVREPEGSCRRLQDTATFTGHRAEHGGQNP